MQAATVLALCLAFSQMLSKRFPKEEIFFMFFLTRSFTRLLYSFENLALEEKTADGLLLISHKKEDCFHGQLNTAELERDNI